MSHSNDIVSIETDFLKEFFLNKNPYNILKCSKNDSIETIKKNYNLIRSETIEKYSINNNNHNTRKEKQKEKELERELKIIDYSYRVLSDSKLKQTYDTLIEERENNGKIEYFSLVTSLIGYASNRIFTKIQSMPSIASPIGIAKSIYQTEGFKGFYRGCSFLFIITPLKNYCVSILSNPVNHYIKKYYINKNDSYNKNKKEEELDFGPIIKSVISFFLSYPFLVTHSCILLSNETNGTTWDIVKKIFNSNKRSLYYAFGYTVALDAFIQSTKLTYYFIGRKIENLYQTNKNNTFYYSLNYVFNNIVCKTLMISLISCPIAYIKIQYPIQLLKQLIINNNSSLEFPISPFIIFNQLYSQNGISKFYNGFLFFFIYQLSFEKIKNL